MPRTVTQRELLLCTLARQKTLVGDDQLEAAIRQWRADSKLPLIEVLAVHGKLSPEQVAKLEAAGATGVIFGTSGTDVERELHAFARLVTASEMTRIGIRRCRSGRQARTSARHEAEGT